MQQGIESTPLRLDVESSFEESFGLVSPFRNDDFDGERNAFEGESNGESRTGWDNNFQSLPSPFGLGLDMDMEQEFFRSDINEDCKVIGPTLAQLNDLRSLSPLINPEMERLHRIATRTEGDLSLSSLGCTVRRPQAYIALEISGEKAEKPIIQVKKEALDSNECGERFGSSNVLKETAERKIPCMEPTWTVTHSTTTLRCNADSKETEDGKSRHKFNMLEGKLGCDVITQVPTLVSSQMKAQIYSEGVEEIQIKREEDATEQECFATDPQSPAVDDESADEEMDSDDDDFEVENHSQESGVARNRKGRRGETDDLSPNPRKLLEISRELDRLNKVIGDLKPINKLPQNARNKSRKEKNKLASRACRLKKKAQHEANKVKLHGLELEQQRLTDVIDKVKGEILKGSSKPVVQKGSLSSQVEGLIKSTFGNQLVAGHTSDFVHSVLKATARSTPTLEGLDELSMCF